MGYTIGETVRVLSSYNFEWATVVKVNRVKVKIRFNNGYETSVNPDKIAKLDDFVGIVWVTNSKVAVASRYYIDRSKYPQFHSEAKNIPRQLNVGYIREDQDGNLLTNGQVYTQQTAISEQKKIESLLNLLK